MHESELKEQKTIEERLDSLTEDYPINEYTKKSGVKVKAHTRGEGNLPEPIIPSHKLIKVEKIKKKNVFDKWLDTFVDEKGLDPEQTFEFTVDGTWNYMPLGVVLETIKSLPKSQRDKIKDTIVKIDFKAGDVMHYFEYLAKGIASIGGSGTS